MNRQYNRSRPSIFAAAHISGANGAILSGYGVSASTNPATGRYQITFENPHPQGADYVIATSVEEDVSNRDGRDLQIIAGTKNANGFQAMITTGDNGGTADGFVEENWSFTVLQF